MLECSPHGLPVPEQKFWNLVHFSTLSLATFSSGYEKHSRFTNSRLDLDSCSYQYHSPSTQQPQLQFIAMGTKAVWKQKRVSPSSQASSRSVSEATSSRSTIEDEQATTTENSVRDDASTTHSDAEQSEADDSEAGRKAEAQSGDQNSQRSAVDTAKARTKLHHVAKTLRATAKKTKAFEVQKLVKKLKGLQKKPSLADQAELVQNELTALKSIDINLLASRALITKMVKARLLPRSAELASADQEEYVYLQMVREEELLGEGVLFERASREADRAAERVKAKITSSKMLADQVGKFVEDLKKLAGIESSVKKEAEVDGKGKAKAKLEDDQEDEEQREWSGSEDESDLEDDAPRRWPLFDNNHEDQEEQADEEELMRIGREKMKALGDLSQWDDMIGSESGDESGLVDDPGLPNRKRKAGAESDVSSDDASSDEEETDDSASESDDQQDSGSDSESESDASSSAEPRRKRKATSSASKPSKKTKSSSSTFLPSLSTGFIAGRSDDEWSDAEADLADRDLSELRSGTKKERKNRMGQRARKALYEKKYGSNANHIKMREKKKVAKLECVAPTSSGARQRPPAFQAPAKSDGGWGGAVAPLPKQPKRPFVPRPERSAFPVEGRNSARETKPAPAPAAKSQEMHPSWIAKQKQKELMAQVKPQGKKVVFD